MFAIVYVRRCRILALRMLGVAYAVMFLLAVAYVRLAYSPSLRGLGGVPFNYRPLVRLVFLGSLILAIAYAKLINSFNQLNHS